MFNMHSTVTWVFTQFKWSSYFFAIFTVGVLLSKICMYLFDMSIQKKQINLQGPWEHTVMGMLMYLCKSSWYMTVRSRRRALTANYFLDELQLQKLNCILTWSWWSLGDFNEILQLVFIALSTWNIFSYFHCQNSHGFSLRATPVPL